MKGPTVTPHAKYKEKLSVGFFFDNQTRVDCDILGDSVETILETAICFARIKISAERRTKETHIMHNLIFNESHSKQLADLLDALPIKLVTFQHSIVNSVLCTVLATRLYAIDLSFNRSTIDSDAFLKHLESRSSSFGFLELKDTVLDESALRRIFNHFHLFEYLHVGLLPHDLLLNFMSSSLKMIRFTVSTEAETIDLTETDIVANSIHINLASGSPFPTRFMLSFLRRVTQLGHAEMLGFTMCNEHRVPVEVGKALVEAVVASKKLRFFSLDDYPNVSDSFIKDMFVVAESHEALRHLRISVYPNNLDPNFLWLKRLLQRNRYIDVLDDLTDKPFEADDEVDEIRGLNRFFRGSEDLKKDPGEIRLSLVGTAFIHSAVYDFPRAGMLLIDHVDVLCEIWHEIESSSGVATFVHGASTEDIVPPATTMASAESTHGFKRKRKIDS